MLAIECTRYGSPEVLKLREVDQPQPGKKEVLIKIHATAVTASDVLIRGLNAPFLGRLIVQLVFGFGKPRNPIMGMVISGTVVKKGKNVTMFQNGDEVFGYCSVSPLKHKFGSYAEYICLPEEWNLATKPANLSFEEAAAIPYGGLLASYMMKKTEIQKGDKVLIYGASGSIGTMAVQLAKNAGAEVTSVCSGKNFELVKNLGSDHLIDYTRSDAEAELETYKYVIDAVGKSKTSSLKEKSKKAILPKGKYISIDDGTPQTPKESFLNLKKLAEAGKITPVIDRIYDIEEMANAHRYVEGGHKKGNVIVTI